MHRRFPLLARLVSVLFLTVAVSVITLVGLTLSLQQIVGEDMNRKLEVTLNLAMNVEESLLSEGLVAMEQVARAIASDPAVIAATEPIDLRRFAQAFPRADMLLIVDHEGRVRGRSTSPNAGDLFLLNGLTVKAIAEGVPMSYPSLIGPEEIQWEGEAIRELVDMPILATNRSTDPRPGERVDTALALVGVVPIRDAAGVVIGAAVAADVLNRDFRIVDEISGLSPDGVPMNATIAMDGIRVTTNVKLTDPEGNPTEHRALGTIYSDMVMASLRANEEYRGRASVVDQWQRTIYRPMTDFQGQVIAGPYVGIPEAYFTALGSRLMRTIAVASAVGGTALIVGLLVAFWLSQRVVTDQVNVAAAKVRTIAEDVLGSSESLHRAVARSVADTQRLSVAGEALQLAAGRVESAVQTTARVRELEGAVTAIADGARSAERAVRYTGRIVEEIAATMEASREAMDRATEGAGHLTAGARAGLKQAMEVTAGLALLYRELPEGEQRNRVAALLKDPSELLLHMASLSERLAGQVRSLSITLQENQARLSFIREEMERVGAVVESTAESTSQAKENAGLVAGWMERMAGATVEAARQAEAAHGALEAVAEANRTLEELSGQMLDQANRLRETVNEITRV